MNTPQGTMAKSEAEAGPQIKGGACWWFGHWIAEILGLGRLMHCPVAVEPMRM